MLINFIRSTDKDTSNTWRNFVALLTVLIGVGLSVGPNIGLAEPVLEVSNKLLPKIIPSYVPKVLVAGDITVQPPQVVIPHKPIPRLVGTLPPPEEFTAKSLFVKDMESNKVLYAKDEYTPRPIASITKLMSALVLLEQPIQWASSTEVVAGELVDNHMYAGEVYSAEDLWNAGLVASSNKAIMSLVVASGWNMPQFVARMNEKALELGMTHTQFVEPTGLDQGNVSTASDIALLLTEALKHEKIITALMQKEYTISFDENNHHMWNTNWLLLNWIPQTDFEVVAGKTGYIIASGYNFTVQGKTPQEKNILVVVLGADTHEARFAEARDVGLEVSEAYIWE